MWRYSALAAVLVLVVAACVQPTSDGAVGSSVTETTTIVLVVDDQTITVTRPVGCVSEPGAPTDLDSEPSQWLAFGEYKRWSDSEGCPVRVDVVAHINGAEHCDVQDAEFITIGRPLGVGVEYLSPETANRYVWNAGGVVRGLPPAKTVSSSDLPASAVDTGYVREADRLWLDEADASVLYVVAGETARVFVRDFEAGVCQ